MSRYKAQEWDDRYQSSGHNLASPREFLVESLHHLPQHGWGLDVAMGEGHNANLLAERGLKVLGIDFSMVALRKAHRIYPELNLALVNLPAVKLTPHLFDVILNFWFLDRTMFPLYHQLLKPGGFLMIETMRFDPDRDQSHLRYEYLIQSGELLQSFSGWDFLVYDENVQATAKGKQQLAVRMLAHKPTDR
jgi:2-polyprenyl-3-methyl-5-hydroxy-6-metoxy-1,4-benzoquinol methylase